MGVKLDKLISVDRGCVVYGWVGVYGVSLSVVVVSCRLGLFHCAFPHCSCSELR